MGFASKLRGEERRDRLYDAGTGKAVRRPRAPSVGGDNTIIVPLTAEINAHTKTGAVRRVLLSRHPAFLQIDEAKNEKVIRMANGPWISFRRSHKSLDLGMLQGTRKRTAGAVFEARSPLEEKTQADRGVCGVEPSKFGMVRTEEQSGRFQAAGLRNRTSEEQRAHPPARF